MDIIVQSARDLIKFKLISSVSTGDKTYDNLIVALCTAVLTVLLSDKIWSWVLRRFRVWMKTAGLENKDIATYYANVLTNCKYSTVFDTSNDDDLLALVDFSTTVKYYCNNNRTVPRTANQSSRLIHPLTMSQTDTSILSQIYIVMALGNTFSSLYCEISDDKSLGICPVYLSAFGPVGIRGLNATTSYCTLNIHYNDTRAYDEFMKHLKDKYVSPFKPVLKSSEQVIEYESEKYPIYPNRTFDNIVSKHKPAILNHITRFVDANKGVSHFNGFDNYNLGIILFGEPGTGKTSFIKAICNYLKRDGLVKDMREIKTNAAFKDLFKKRVDEVVYVFDEFDCVQGVISREIDNSSTLSSYNLCKKELSEKYMALLALQSKDEKDSENLKREMESVRHELKELENRLTLDNMLTVLDGPIEMRNRVIIACTNHIDRIDPALLRAGRFELKIKLEAFTSEETAELLYKIFSGDTNSDYINNKKFKSYTPTAIINKCHELRELKAVVDFLCLQ